MAGYWALQAKTQVYTGLAQHSCWNDKVQSWGMRTVFQSKINRPTSPLLTRWFGFGFHFRQIAGACNARRSQWEAQIPSITRNHNLLLSHSVSEHIEVNNKMTYTTSLEMIQETIALQRRQDALSVGRSFLQMTGGCVWTHTGGNVMQDKQWADYNSFP